MTDFETGPRRRNPYNQTSGVSASWARPAPRGSEHDRGPAYASASRRRVSGLLDHGEDTGPVGHISGPLPDLPWWSTAAGVDAAPASPESRHRGASDDFPGDRGAPAPTPLPPLPSSAWSRLQGPGGADASRPRAGAPRGRHGRVLPEDDATDAHGFEPVDWDDRTGGLEVIGAHVDEEPPRGWRRRRGAAASELDHADEHLPAEPEPAGYHPHDDLHADSPADLHDELLPDDAGHELPLADEDIPLKPFDRRRIRARRRRRRAAAVIALVVLAGVVVGIVFGGSRLLGVINPSSRDYVGSGYGAVNIRVHDGDTLSDIARTLVDANVIEGTGHFVSAAKNNPAATGISPGVYGMRLHMSGSSALNRLLDPAARLLSRVTLPEGLTAAATLKRLSDQTHVPLTDLQAAAQNPAQLGLPAYANGKLEGFLFPATYDFDPHSTAADLLKAMVSRTVQALDQLQIPADQRLNVLTKASIVQAESGSISDMGKVARVLDNRLAANMPLQLDTTVNYATGKTGLTTSDQDRANPSPYNTYVHPGLPPGPISNPGEEALKATLSPTAGPWMFFVVVNPDTGETRFATTQQEHEQNVQQFQAWLRAHPNG